MYRAAIIWVVFVGIVYIDLPYKNAQLQAANAANVLIGIIFPYVLYRIGATAIMLKQQETIIKLLKGDKDVNTNHSLLPEWFPKWYFWNKPK
jgi:hypothetical protein